MAQVYAYLKYKMLSLLKKYKLHLSALFGYLLLAVIISLPLVFKLNRYFPETRIGDACDAENFLWTYWWSKTALFHSSLFFTNMQFFPVGKDVLAYNGGFLIPLISVPFQYLFGLICSYNLIILLAFTFAGYGMYLLAKYLLKNELAAFISGFIFLFNPFLLFLVAKGLASLIMVGFVPMYILYLLKASENEGIKNIFISALFLLLIAFSTFHYTMVVLIFTAFYSLILIYRLDKSAIRRIGMIILVFIVVSSPYIYLFLKHIISGSFSGFSNLKLPLFFKGNVIDDPDKPIHYILGGGSFVQAGIFHRIKESISDIPFTLILLVLVSLFIKNKGKLKFWLFSAFLFLLFACGPYLMIKKGFAITPETVIIPLPFLLFYNFIPFFSRFHWPERFLVVAYLSLAMISGYSLKYIFGFIKSRICQVFLGGLFILLLIAETWVCSLTYFPLKLRKADIPAYYYKLAKEKDCAIIEYPLTFYPPLSAKYIYYQTVHHKKLFEGLAAPFLFPLELKKFMANNKFLVCLNRLQEDVGSLKELEGEDIAAIRNLGFRYLVVHINSIKPELKDEIIKSIDNLLGNPEIYEEGIIVYKL
jgi:hypothetical protein